MTTSKQSSLYHSELQKHLTTLLRMATCLHYFSWYIPFLLRDVCRLFCFVIMLAPGFLRFFWYYVWTSGRIIRRYDNRSCRQFLDLYKAKNNSGDSSLAPVVVFYTGGAWCIGYKMWGALMARALTHAGILVVIPDYRNYPCARVPEMVDDVEKSLLWVKHHVREYGGDPNKIVVVGQSAGGHLACTLFLKKAMELVESEESVDASAITLQHANLEETKECLENTFRPTDFCGFISLSAPYDLDAMQSTFRRHGLDEDIVDRVFDGQGDAYTPTRIARECQRQHYDLSGKIPPMTIIHGTADITVPYHGSSTFHRQLGAVVNDETAVKFVTYDGWSHTDGILEMPMNANHRFHKDVFDAVKDWTFTGTLEWPADDPIITKRLCPKCLIGLGQKCNPF